MSETPRTDAIMHLVNRMVDATGEKFFALREGAENGIAALERELIGARRERDEARKDAGRLDYMLLNLSGTALWSVLGEMSDTSDLNEFRASIDAVMEKK